MTCPLCNLELGKVPARDEFGENIAYKCPASHFIRYYNPDNSVRADNYWVGEYFIAQSYDPGTAVFYENKTGFWRFIGETPMFEVRSESQLIQRAKTVMVFS